MSRLLRGAHLEGFASWRPTPLSTSATRWLPVSDSKSDLEILGQHIIRAFAPTLVDLGCRRVNPLAIEIEGFQQPRLVEGHVGLDLLQRTFAYEERRFQGAVVPPK